MKDENTVLSDRLAEQSKEMDSLRSTKHEVGDDKMKKVNKVETNGKQRKFTSKKKTAQKRSPSSLPLTPSSNTQEHAQVQVHKTVQAALQRMQNLQQRVDVNMYVLRKEEMQSDLQAII